MQHLLLVALLCFADLPAVRVEASAASPGCPSRLLLIGNSYSAYNAFPDLVKSLLRGSAGCPNATVDTHIVFGTSLADHAVALTDPSSRLYSLLGAGRADANAPNYTGVVLQDQSQAPGLGASINPTALTLYAARGAAVRLLSQAAAAAGAPAPVLYNTWGYQHGDPSNPVLYGSYELMQDATDYGYETYREKYAPSAAVAPVGAAFRRVYLDGGSDPDFPDFAALYDADGRHPSAQGSYLAALVVANTLVSGPGAGRALNSAPSLNGSSPLYTGSTSSSSSTTSYSASYAPVCLRGSAPKGVTAEKADYLEDVACETVAAAIATYAG